MAMMVALQQQELVQHLLLWLPGSRSNDLLLKTQYYTKYTWCNIDFKTSLAEPGKLPLKFTGPAGTFTCPATLLNKGEYVVILRINITCQAGQVRVLLCLPDCRFAPNSPATCKGSSDYVAIQVKMC